MNEQNTKTAEEIATTSIQIALSKAEKDREELKAVIERVEKERDILLGKAESQLQFWLEYARDGDMFDSGRDTMEVLKLIRAVMKGESPEELKERASFTMGLKNERDRLLNQIDGWKLKLSLAESNNILLNRENGELKEKVVLRGNLYDEIKTLNKELRSTIQQLTRENKRLKSMLDSATKGEAK